MEIFLLACGPFVTLLTGITLRLCALYLTESSSNEWRAILFTRISYTMMLISLFGMVLVCYIVPLLGCVGFLLTVLLIGMFVQGEIRYGGMRRRAQQVEMLWVLALAVKSGRPLGDEIESYAEGTWGPRRKLLMEMAERLTEGAPLSEISIPLGLVSNASAMQIHAGIASHALESTLSKTAHRVTEDFADDQDGECFGGLLYPPALLTIASLVVGFVMYWIIPKFKKIFDDFGTELPGSTVLLINIADATVNYWFLIGLPIFLYLPVTVFGIAAFGEYYGWHAMLQSVLGRWFIRWHTPDVLRALSLCLAQDMPINQALVPIMQVIGPHKLHNKLALATEAMDDGADSWQTLQQAGLLKSDETALLEIAQKNGNLPWVLDCLAKTIESRRMYRMQSVLEIVQPLFLIPIALVIGFIAIAIFMPLIKLLNDLS